MMLTVEAVITMFLTTICTWMASTGDAPAIMRPVMAPGKETNPIVLALSMEGAKAIPSALFACWSVAWSGVAPRAMTVMALPTIRPAAGMMYRGVNGNTLSMRIRIMVITVPTKMDTKEIYFPRGTCFARWPAV
uniref:Secreted protein n=1 Tax=Setaria italica TaxID=4555 RepID=K3Y2X9_SETIT